MLIISDGGDNHSRYTENDIRGSFAKPMFRRMRSASSSGLAARRRKSDGSVAARRSDRNNGRPRPAVGTLSELPDLVTKISMEFRNNMSSEITRVIRPTMGNGAKSRSSSAHRRVFRGNGVRKVWIFGAGGSSASAPSRPALLSFVRGPAAPNCQGVAIPSRIGAPILHPPSRGSSPEGVIGPRSEVDFVVLHVTVS